MPLLVRCPYPSCGATARVAAEHLGRQVRCPRCGRVFALGRTPPAATLDLPPAPPRAPPPAVTLDLPAAPAPTPSEGRADWRSEPAHPSAAPPQAVPARIGRFAVRRFLGEGTFGRVYEAHDPQLDRAVAVKVAKPEQVGTEDRVQRFLREARAAANLRHPHIVPVFEAGNDGGRYFIASAFIPGRTLEAALHEARPDCRRAARLVRQLAEALAYAHGRGIVHRDVKPGNVLLDEHGQPLLMDFGLAARREEAARLTQDGAAMGTPLYMAPEQWAGRAVAASDQYSLGVVLFELLAGRPPFAGTPELLAFLHQSHDAPSPRAVNRRVPRDLETVCLKCLEKDPARRYADCQALADDLRRWLEGEPVRARRVSLAGRAARWARREPKLALAAGAAALLAVALAIGVGVAVEVRRGLLERAGSEASGRELQHRTSLYIQDFNQALQDWEANDLAKAQEFLDKADPELRGWEWHYLRALCRRKHQTFTGHKGAVHAVCFSRDGTRLASAADDGTVKVWDARTGQVQHTVPAGTNLVIGLCFDADGTRLAVASPAGTVTLWDLSTGREAGRFEVPEVDAARSARDDDGPALAFSPDGRRLATFAEDNTVKVRDARTGQELCTCRGSDASARALAFSADGKRLASTGSKGAVKVWDAETGQELATIPASVPGLEVAVRLCFSPDGRSLAGVVADHFDDATEQDQAAIQKKLAKRLGGGGGGGLGAGGGVAVKVWDLDSKKETRTLLDTLEDPKFSSLSWSPDGKRLAGLTEDGVVQVWDPAAGRALPAVKDPNARLASVAFSPDGKRLAGGTHDGTVQVRQLEAGRESLRFESPDGLCAFAFTPDGPRLACARPDPVPNGRKASVNVLDVRTGKEVLTIPCDASIALSLGFSPDGSRLAGVRIPFGLPGAGAKQSPDVRVWDARTGNEVLAIDAGPTAVGFSPDGTRLVGIVAEAGQGQQGSATTGLREWSAQTGKEVLALKLPGASGPGVSSSPDGAFLAGGGTDSAVRVWDARTGREVRTLTGLGHPVTAAAFSADGKRLAAGGATGEIKVWEVETGREVGSFRGHAALAITGLAFSPDGTRLVSAASLGATGEGVGGAGPMEVPQGEMKFWDVRTGLEVLSVPSDPGMGEMMQVSFRPDGKQLAVTGQSLFHTVYTVTIWDAE
jgi:WD40 repeat protein/tRNA A-37 threonylcarbamoyl transferase component Bud32